MIDVFAGVLARGPVREAVGDRAWLQALLDVEAALARAQARVGLISAEEAEAIAAACDAAGYSAAEIGAAAAKGGNPAQPVVTALTARVEGPARGHVHRGATSQDVVDTAAMLVARRALDLLLADLAGAADAAAELARAHRDTPMAARTLLQQAVPTTFGLKAVGWMTALDAARARLATVRDERLAVQLGGAAGTLASLGADGLAVLRALAQELGLAEPVLPWHTDRTRVGELAGALGEACGAVAKAARDVTLLSQTEVGEVREAAGGGSSTMPHKRNPVASIAAVACARRAPGLVADVLAAMEHEHERAAGAWHAEWAPLNDLLVAAGSAAAWLRACLEGLEVDAERMRANLALTGGLLMAERVSTALGRTLGRGAAHEVVERAAAAAADGGRPFADVLRDDPEIRERVGAGEIDRLLDPAGYLGSAGALVDRALEAHRMLGLAP
ncbi:MAG: 3-carboxy-cis,cis-muconate cycloisomerase [Solirubrobacteraceae bacterium]|nr:3-carboxy-cis,cis-muconate cycloisomerase [Solirubrobacteraceae bacterium]